MAFCNQEPERVDRGEVDEHENEHEEDIVENEILDSYVPCEEPRSGPIGTM